MTEIIIDEQEYLFIVKDVEDTMSKFNEQGAHMKNYMNCTTVLIAV